MTPFAPTDVLTYGGWYASDGAMQLSIYDVVAGNASGVVVPVAAPSVDTSFGQATVPLNGAVSLAFTITNPAANTVPQVGIAFTDTLPAGLVVATPNALTSNCGGTVTAVAGASSVSLGAGALAPNASCTVTLNVTGTIAGVKSNSVEVSSANGGTGNTATATLTVQPALPPAPTVTGIAPAVGSTAGGTLVTVSGTNFTGATGVTIGGVSATGISVVDANTIIATTPAGTVGAKDVAVTTAGGTGTGALFLTYVAAVAASAVPVPGLQPWAVMLLTFLLIGAGWGLLSRRG